MCGQGHPTHLLSLASATVKCTTQVTGATAARREKMRVRGQEWGKTEGRRKVEGIRE